MVNYDITHLLYIEPKLPPSENPQHDEISKKYEYIIEQWGSDTPNKSFRGFHLCSCGETSDNHDHTLKNNMHYNSLGLHYLLYHREEIPESEIRKINDLFDVIKNNDMDSELFHLPLTPLYSKDNRTNPEEELNKMIKKMAKDIEKEVNNSIITELLLGQNR
jgi:hypothetical protein